MWLICIIFAHKWGKWKYIKPIGRYDEKLKRTCQRCGKVEEYIGSTKINNNGDKVPW